jgi:2-polyprenyl-3-methyl-5-hydroxy-6-metoxy-1,4-benzoquinol methylase
MAANEPNNGDASEVRFAFGANWSRFLQVVNEERIQTAEDALRSMLEVDSLAGKTFLDIGSGSGLSSLAARRLGASVRSFDYDVQSVECTTELRRRYFPNSPEWKVERGSVLDVDYLRTLGRWDIVYSWGVLHHTGDMWQALANVAPLVADAGTLFVAIYNDQGFWSKRWKTFKRTYNVLPAPLRPFFGALIMGPRELSTLAWSTLARKPGVYFDNIINYAQRSTRGMSYWHDLVDWIGGYPFEVAKPEEIFEFYRDRGFALRLMRTCAGGLGCNEFVFHQRRGAAAS